MGRGGVKFNFVSVENNNDRKKFKYVLGCRMSSNNGRTTTPDTIVIKRELFIHTLPTG